MKKITFLFLTCFSFVGVFSQGPVVTSWLQNTTGITGRHYVSGNPTPIVDAVEANVQTVQYSNSWVYVSTNGIPSYITGPFLDGNPSIATDQNAIFKITRTPVQNTGTLTPTNAGNIGIFINGVALFDYRDGVSYKLSTGQDAGGPMGGPGDGVWNRDAVPAEMDGFDCAKGHPAMGNYHHHQNPSAFNLDLAVVSNVCDIYTADGLYVIDSTVHSPLLGFAYDGFPIYGAYGYKNANGTGGIVRMKSAYQLRNISVRTHYADGTDVTNGPAVNTTFPLGHYREDYEFVNPPVGEEEYLDVHNGRFSITPEYPAGIYCYFTTVDENWNSAYPYVVGPTFYGTVTASKVTSISESTTTYTPTTSIENNSGDEFKITVYPNPASEFAAVQLNGVNNIDSKVQMFDMHGKLVHQSCIYQGSTITYVDLRTIYNGEYIIVLSTQDNVLKSKLIVSH